MSSEFCKEYLYVYMWKKQCSIMVEPPKLLKYNFQKGKIDTHQI